MIHTFHDLISSLSLAIMEKTDNFQPLWHGMIFPLEEKFAYILATRKQTTDESLAPLYDGDVQIRDLKTTFELLL